MQRAVGDHIQGLPARQGESEHRLWSFVSSFTENKMDGDKLQKLYVKLKANKAAPSGACVHAHACRMASVACLEALQTPGSCRHSHVASFPCHACSLLMCQAFAQRPG